MKKLLPILTLTLPLCITANTHAGINGLTIHSRANCVGINESISWDLLSYHDLIVNAVHINTTTEHYHNLSTHWIYTWRAASLHWQEEEQKGHWVVAASHAEDICGKILDLGDEQVTDCSIYDGWWDVKEAPTQIERDCTDPNDPDYKPQKPSAYARILLGYRDNAKKQIMAYKGITDPLSTHIRLDPAQLKLSFAYKTPHIPNQEVIGYAPVGMYQHGWTGVIAFFATPELGICSLETNSRGRILVDKWRALITGNATSGYRYRLNWQDDNTRYDFNCANKQYDKRILEQMKSYLL